MIGKTQNIFLHIEQVLLLLLFFILPLYKPLAPLIILLWGLSSLILSFSFIKIKLPKAPTKTNILLLLLPLFYFLYAFGLFYTQNIDFAKFDLEVKMALAIIPLLLLLRQKVPFLNFFKKYFLTAFAAGTFLNILINLSLSSLEYATTKSYDSFLYVQVSRFFHPSYMSIYASVTMFYLLIKLVENIRKSKIKIVVIFSILLLIVFAYTLLLLSKAGIIGIFIVLILFLIQQYYKKIGWKKFSLIFVFVFLAFVSIIYSVPSLRMRFDVMLNAISSYDESVKNVQDGTSSRIKVWEVSWKLAIKNLPFGVGTGDIKDELIAAYKDSGMDYIASQKLNSHNQYLQSFLAIGILGLLSLLAIFILPIVFYGKNIDKYFLLLILLFSFNMLFESMLEVQAGVVFFAVFYPILVLRNSDKNKNQGAL